MCHIQQEPATEIHHLATLNLALTSIPKASLISPFHHPYTAISDQNQNSSPLGEWRAHYVDITDTTVRAAGHVAIRIVEEGEFE